MRFCPNGQSRYFYAVIDMQGRIKIKTDVPEITFDNCIDVLRKALSSHYLNADRIQFLLDYEEGVQPLLREKTYRTDIDCQIVDNTANEIVEFKVGFHYGNPITFKKRDIVEGKIEAVQEFNDQYLLTDANSANQELARYFEIGGICCTYIDTNENYEDGDSYYIRTVLDPRTSFVVYSSYYPDGREMMGVTYRKDSDGTYRYTCFSKDWRYEIKNWQVVNGDGTTSEFWGHDSRSGEENPLHIIPITEYFRSYDRMGCFERQIDEMDNLNLLISDFSNDVDQNTQTIWWTNDCEFQTVQVQNEDGTVTEKVVHPKSNEWLQTYTTRDGKIPKVQPLTVNYDYAGILSNILAQRALILQKCAVPQRNDNSGGSTGVAMSDATGWSAAETAASKEEMVISKSLRKELKVICAAIRESTHCPSDSVLKELLPSDLEPSIKRQKSYELSVKTTAIATLLGQGFSLEDTLDAVALFPDPAQVIERSKEGVEKKQNLSEEKEVTPTSDDPINQIDNSPIIDGMSMENGTDEN